MAGRTGAKFRAAANTSERALGGKQRGFAILQSSSCKIGLDRHHEDFDNEAESMVCGSGSTWREGHFWQNGIRLVTGGGTSIIGAFETLKLESAPALQSCEPIKRVGRTTGSGGLGPRPRQHQLFPLPVGVTCSSGGTYGRKNWPCAAETYSANSLGGLCGVSVQKPLRPIFEFHACRHMMTRYYMIG